MDPDKLRLELAKKANELAVCAILALAEQNLLTGPRSKEAEGLLRELAALSMRGSAQIAETVFENLADHLRDTRERNQDSNP